MSQSPKPPPEVLDFYALGGETGRLDEGYFPLERARTRELVARHLPPPPGVVLDVGGAAGAYAFWLAEQGYEVHLSDPVPLHVQQSAEASEKLKSGKLASVRLGDARALDRANESADAVLLLGPLYHLPERADRRAALAEAHRALRPGGWLFAAAISRGASLLDNLRGPIFDVPGVAAMIERDLETGRHVNDVGHPQFFTTSFFHEPPELAREVQEAGFVGVGSALPDVFAIEGPGAFLPDFPARWQDPAHRETLLRLLRHVELDPSLVGMSPHLLAVARRA